MDENLWWHGFTCIPDLCVLDAAWLFCDMLHAKILLPKNNRVEFTGDWRDSLAVRPGYEP